jgi:hypothetical protein
LLLVAPWIRANFSVNVIGCVSFLSKSWTLLPSLKSKWLAGLERVREVLFFLFFVDATSSKASAFLLFFDSSLETSLDAS